MVDPGRRMVLQDRRKRENSRSQDAPEDRSETDGELLAVFVLRANEGQRWAAKLHCKFRKLSPHPQEDEEFPETSDLPHFQLPDDEEEEEEEQYEEEEEQYEEEEEEGGNDDRLQYVQDGEPGASPDPELPNHEYP